MNTLSQASLLSLSQAVGERLKARGLTLVTAESCTGGGIASLITEVAGSSQWFDRGLVVYSNRAKQDLLAVKASTLEQYGAVSEATAHEMALGALQHSTAQVSIAVTGIAGPTGATKDKPVGTVWFGWGLPEQRVVCQVQHFSGDRHSVREQTVHTALTYLLTQI